MPTPEPAVSGADERVGNLVVDRVVDDESARWIAALGVDVPDREQSLADLHALLLRIARAEVHRRSGPLRVAGAELDDIAHQAAADALMAITGKLAEFRGESRFTTWAYKFVMFEVSSKVARHFWRHETVALEAEDWERLPDRFGLDPAQGAQWRDLVDALYRAVDTELSERQRHVVVAIVLDGVPLDALAEQLDSNRNAIYKMMFDARRQLRAYLVTNGYLDSASGSDETGPA